LAPFNRPTDYQFTPLVSRLLVAREDVRVL
jgi:hypothetical protein